MKKKKIILTIITFIFSIIGLILIFYVMNKFILKLNFEKSIMSFSDMNKELTFKIDKIVLFSSADAKNKNISKSNFTIEDLYQYTDVALFITSNDTEKNLKNTFKKVSLTNFKYINTPEVGEQSIYFKSINNFSKSDFPDETNKIIDNIDYEISSKDNEDLSKPVLYNNLANPITFTYINDNIKQDYTITDTTIPITYDGSLLKTCNIPLSSLKSKISFDIFITNNLNEEYKCSVFLDVPLEDSNQSIYNGNITLRQQNTSYTFYRYK